MKYSKPRNHSFPNHLWMVVGVGNSPGYIIYLLVKSSALHWFMISFEKVGQKVHQNHATSLECNHDRIVIPVPEFVPFVCSLSSGLSFATFFVQSGLNCCAMQQNGLSCCAKQQNGWTQLFCNVEKWTEFLKRFRNLDFLDFPNYGFPTTQRLHLLCTCGSFVF